MKKLIVKLRVLSGHASGSTFPLTQDSTILGRGEGVDLPIVDGSISRQHCQIIREEERYYIKDLNSKNGTHLRGIKLSPGQFYEIQPNSDIQVGSINLIFSVEMVESASKRMQTPQGDTTLGFEEDDETTKEIKPDSPQGQEHVHTTLPFNIVSNRNLVAIYKVLGSIGAIFERKFLFQKSVDLVTEVLDADRGFVFLASDLEGEKARPAVSKIRGGGGHGDVPSDLNWSAIYQVFNEGISVISSGVPAAYSQGAAAGKQEGKGRSAICSPVQSRDKIFGVMYIDSAAGADFFVRNDVELLTAIGIHIGALTENIELVTNNRDLFIGVIRTLVNILEAKDHYTFGHSERVTNISLAIADELELGQNEKEALRIASLIHDIGKVVISEEVLNKVSPLTDVEFSEIKKHPTIGCTFVRHLSGFDMIRSGIMFHHERVDGDGYPKRKKGEEIPLIARIIAVADSFDAMTSDRPYRKGFTEDYALTELHANIGSQFDGRVIDAFMKAYQSGKVATRRERPISILMSKKIDTAQ